MTRPLVARTVALTVAFKRWGKPETRVSRQVSYVTNGPVPRDVDACRRRAPRRCDLAVPAAPPRRVTGCTPRLPRARSDRPLPSRRGRCFRAARSRPVGRLARASPRARRSGDFSGRRARRRPARSRVRTPPRLLTRWTLPTARAFWRWHNARTTPGPGTSPPTRRQSDAPRTARREK